jgi:hypothetical protein
MIIDCEEDLPPRGASIDVCVMPLRKIDSICGLVCLVLQLTSASASAGSNGNTYRRIGLCWISYVRCKPHAHLEDKWRQKYFDTLRRMLSKKQVVKVRIV